jgi:hypothetical protein
VTASEPTVDRHEEIVDQIGHAAVVLKADHAAAVASVPKRRRQESPTLWTTRLIAVKACVS